MALSRKPRHWIPLPLAVLWTVVAILQVADFSGEPAPRWRTIALTLLAPLCLGLMVLNMVLDGREKQDQSTNGRP